MTIYPDIIPPMDGHPTAAQFEIAATDDGRGRGFRAKAAFRAGERVARLSGVLTNQTTLATLQITPALHLHDPWFCRYILHACDPNLALDAAAMELRATRDIRPGDFLTLDYAASDDRVFQQFPCHCGSPRCRRWITGRREEPNAEGRAWLDANRIQWCQDS